MEKEKNKNFLIVGKIQDNISESDKNLMNMMHFLMNTFFIITCLFGIFLACISFYRIKNIGHLLIGFVFIIELLITLLSWHSVSKLSYLPINNLEMRGIEYVGYSSDTTANAKFSNYTKKGSYNFRIPVGNILLIFALWQLGWGSKRKSN